MMPSIRKALRWAISALLVTLPVTYLFWQWRHEEHQVLEGLSYEAFNARIAKDSPAAFWTYFVYVLAAITIVNVATAALAWVLGRVFPDRVVRAPGR